MPFLPAPPHILRRARILLAEDEPFIAFDLASAIEEAGGEVVGPASSVRQALSLIADDRIRAAILDVDLLDGDVGPVIEELTRRGIPVVVHSGGGLPNALRDRFGEVDVYRKPTLPSVLVGRLAGRLKH